MGRVRRRVSPDQHVEHGVRFERDSFLLEGQGHSHSADPGTVAARCARYTAGNVRRPVRDLGCRAAALRQLDEGRPRYIELCRGAGALAGRAADNLQLWSQHKTGIAMDHSWSCGRRYGSDSCLAAVLDLLAIRTQL